MLSSLIVCVLVMGATAFKPPMPFGLKVGVPLPPHDEHELCCAPRYFTFKLTSTTSSKGPDGNLLVEMIHAEGAYDAISEQQSTTLFENFFNKTEHHFKIIQNYRKEVLYFIVKDGEEEVCYVDKTTGQFPEECLPKDAKFVGAASLGDHDLLIDTWYYPNEDSGLIEHTAKSVQHGSCVPISLFSRAFDAETEEEVSATNAGVYDFNLGICDPDEYFKPPESCQPEHALAEPTPEMLKLRRRKGIFI